MLTAGAAINCLELVNLTALMERTAGNPDVRIGLIDGPVVTDHPSLAGEHLRQIGEERAGGCRQSASAACLHGTFVAGILSGRRGSPAPAISPACTLLIRPLFTEAASVGDRMPTATPQELAAAIVECIDAGVRVINLSLALAQPSKGERPLEAALGWAARTGVLVVAAAGNEGTLGSSVLTRHPWVIPVAACDRRGRPMNGSNFGGSIGKRGLTAPGDAITSVSPEGQPLTLGGTSVAVPFVTGTIALLWSEFPSATAPEVKLAVTGSSSSRRASVIPPLLDAQSAYSRMSARS